MTPPDPAAHTALLPLSACAGCHPRQVAEYRPSPMHYAGFSPVFAALETALLEIAAEGHGPTFDETAEGPAQNLCADCHAPAATRSGIGRPSPVMDAPGELAEFSVAMDHRDRLEHPGDQGIPCDLCHRVTGPDHAGSLLGDGVANGAFVVAPGVDKLGPLADPVANSFHGVTSGADAYLSSAEFCGACHDVRLPMTDVVAQERDDQGRPFVRLENLFTEWRQSPWAQVDHPLNPLRGQTGVLGLPDGVVRETSEGAAGEQVTCQDCHMSLYPARGFADEVHYEQAFAGVDPASLTRKAHKLYAAGPAAVDDGAASPPPRRRVSDHSFVAVSNPMVPWPLPEDLPWLEALAPWPETEEAMLADPRATDSQIGVEPRCAPGEISAPCVLARRVAMLRAATTLSLDETALTARPGADLEIRAWVENVGAGHNVPAGFSQEREVWVALTVVDEGRPCTADAECADLIERKRFVDDFPTVCEVHGPDGVLDPVLVPREGTTLEGRMRAERSGICDAERRRCVVYRSGYLLDLDGDGLTRDEDLRQTLAEVDPMTLEERCVLPGADVDQRASGIQQGLISFTNAFQRVATDEAGEPIEAWFAEGLDPGEPPPPAEGPVFEVDPASRRQTWATDQARYERLRYQGAPLVDPVTGQAIPRARVLDVVHPLSANRFFNGQALKPFQPRLARYVVTLPETVQGPLTVEARLRYRFFPPRLLRTLVRRGALRAEARRRAGLEAPAATVTEGMIDLFLIPVEMSADLIGVEIHR